MQIPSSNPDLFIKCMNEKAETIRELFLENIKKLTMKNPLKVMLADGTVTEQESFDPILTIQFFDNLLSQIPEWKNYGVSSTSDQDLRRCFIKFEIKKGNYILSSHMSLQYHALLFYKLDNQVIVILKELAMMTDKINSLRSKAVPENDYIIEEKLRQKGFQNLSHQELFEVLFGHDEVVQELSQSLESSHKEFNDLILKRDQLFRDLDGMLIEVYHTVPILIDETRMIAAEEGCLCNFNLEYFKNNSKEGTIDLSRISENTKTNLLETLDEIINILKK